MGKWVNSVFIHQTLITIYTFDNLSQSPYTQRREQLELFANANSS